MPRRRRGKRGRRPHPGPRRSGKRSDAPSLLVVIAVVILLLAFLLRRVGV